MITSALKQRMARDCGMLDCALGALIKASLRLEGCSMSHFWVNVHWLHFKIPLAVLIYEQPLGFG